MKAYNTSMNVGPATECLYKTTNIVLALAMIIIGSASIYFLIKLNKAYKQKKQQSNMLSIRLLATCVLAFATLLMGVLFFVGYTFAC